MDIKGSKTEKNLMAAFAGESQARNRYSYFASVARKEGYEQISAIFLETADNEKEHAKRFWDLLSGGEAEVVASYPSGKTGNTAENLQAAADGERLEWGKLYPEFSETAKNEGFKLIANVFREIGEVEEQHEARYLKLLANVQNGTVFKKDAPVSWHCRNCGYVHAGTEAPKACPACLHPQSHYQILAENY
jgi:rubrerythrin